MIMGNALKLGSFDNLWQPCAQNTSINISLFAHGQGSWDRRPAGLLKRMFRIRNLLSPKKRQRLKYICLLSVPGKASGHGRPYFWNNSAISVLIFDVSESLHQKNAQKIHLIRVIPTMTCHTVYLNTVSYIF